MALSRSSQATPRPGPKTRPSEIGRVTRYPSSECAIGPRAQRPGRGHFSEWRFRGHHKPLQGRVRKPGLPRSEELPDTQAVNVPLALEHKDLEGATFQNGAFAVITSHSKAGSENQAF